MDKNQQTTKGRCFRKGACCGNFLPFWPKPARCVLEREPTVYCSVAETFYLDSPSISKLLWLSPDVLSISIQYHSNISDQGSILELEHERIDQELVISAKKMSAKLHWKSEAEAPADLRPGATASTGADQQGTAGSEH